MKPALPRYGAARDRKRVGILGGSFNPAHAGHRHISLEALKRLGLDEIWWLVTPCNPLKNPRDMLPLEERVKQAWQVSNHPCIRVWVLEPALNTPYTAVLLERLKARQPWRTLVWLMGADNACQAHRWHKWPEIFKKNKIVIFPRAGYSTRYSLAKATFRFKRNRLPLRQAACTLRGKQVFWTTLPGMPMSPLSSTQLRRTTAGVA